MDFDLPLESDRSVTGEELSGKRVDNTLLRSDMG